MLVYSVEELSGGAAIIESMTFRSFEVYLIVTVLYLGLALALKAGLAFLGHTWFGRSSERAVAPDLRGLS